MSDKKNVSLLSRITVKAVYGDIKKEIVEKVKKLHLMRVYGQATSYKVASSQFGDSLGFMGAFKAINPDTGESFNSGKCFLPKIVENMLGGALESEGCNGVEFAFDLYAVPAKNAFGYEYRVESVIEIQESPVIASLESRMGMAALEDKSGGKAKAK